MCKREEKVLLFRRALLKINSHSLSVPHTKYTQGRIETHTTHNIQHHPGRTVKFQRFVCVTHTQFSEQECECVDIFLFQTKISMKSEIVSILISVLTYLTVENVLKPQYGFEDAEGAPRWYGNAPKNVVL